MVDFIARVAKEGFDAGNTDLKNLNFYETKPTFKIVKQMALASGHDLNVVHGLNYAPNFFSFSDEGGKLYPAGTDRDLTSTGGRNFMVSTSDTELSFDENDTDKKIIILSDVPQKVGYAEQNNVENFVFEIWDGGVPNRKVMSSAFNHLKEYASGVVEFTSDHYNDGQQPPNPGTWSVKITTESAAVAHGLPFRPFVLAWVEATYPFYQTDPSVPMGSPPNLHALPHNDIQYYNPIGFVGLPGNVSGFLTLYYSIDNNEVRFYVKNHSVLFPGTDPIFGQTMNDYQIVCTYRFTYKIFYNDMDEAYSYLA